MPTRTLAAVHTEEEAHRTRREAQYRPDVDGLRAVAVLAVLAFHAFPEHVCGGFVGVDIFFVISGFLITSIILREVADGTFSFARFYARRIRRLFPALVLVLASCLALGWLSLWIDELKQLGKHIATASMFVSNVQLWKESGYFDLASESKPLLHLWSLGIEEQFYLAWPLVIILVAKAHSKIGRWILAVIVVSFAANIVLTQTAASAAFFLPASRFWELMSGAGLAALQRAPLRAVGSGARNAASVLGMAMIAGSIFLLDAQMHFPGGWAALPVVGATLAIAAGPQALPNRSFLSLRPVVLVGLISYPLYLWHWPVLTFARLLSIDPLTALERSMALVLSFALAALTYRFVELPIRHARARKVPASLAAAMAALGGAGVVVWAAGGVPSRYPEQFRHIEEFSLMSDAVSDAWRRHRCMLEGEASYASECIEQLPASRPSVVLWGDSHAAALYPGLRDLEERDQFRLTQFTSSVCPPVFGYVHPNNRYFKPHCAALNSFVEHVVQENPPAVVILAGYWRVYERLDLGPTIAKLRAAGVRQVIVAGDVPSWTRSPSRVMFRLAASNPGNEVPRRIPLARFEGPDRSEHEIARETAMAGAEFVSLRDLICNAQSCAVFTDEGTVFADADHLAPPGSRLVAKLGFERFLTAGQHDALGTPP
ncbi:MAG: acyltransferase [Proteobacteria bacterium]|nr:acyltransferase [Pseudomonadota bacterium]